MPPEEPPAAADLLPVSARDAGGAAFGPGAGEHRIAAKNRWSRAVLDFEGARAEAWCSLEARIAWDFEETAGNALDFALVGFGFWPATAPASTSTTCRASRAACWTRTGPGFPGPPSSRRGASVPARLPLRIAFRVPAPARNLTVSARSWRNTRSFTIADAGTVPLRGMTAGWLTGGADMRLLGTEEISGIEITCRCSGNRKSTYRRISDAADQLIRDNPRKLSL
ncbi:hypothetical protein U8607_08170 [Methylobacterium durans]|uniref:hypothetical protein n=1 Tax=Methylobacterium durans TaxID=2202825 RepID=UPI002AFFA66A|nr:hypothetical protein [Methylobacterium durans]MEA1832057.1 hypothetical protein [Methylobacterium durans]